MANRKGKQNPNAKMTEVVAARVKELIEAGQSLTATAKACGVTYNQVSNIVYRDTWSHVPWPEAVTPVNRLCGLAGCTRVAVTEGEAHGVWCAAHMPEELARRNAEICAARMRGVPIKVVAAEFGLSEARVSQIANGDRPREAKTRR